MRARELKHRVPACLRSVNLSRPMRARELKQWAVVTGRVELTVAPHAGA